MARVTLHGPAFPGRFSSCLDRLPQWGRPAVSQQGVEGDLGCALVESEAVIPRLFRRWARRPSGVPANVRFPLSPVPGSAPGGPALTRDGRSRPRPFPTSYRVAGQGQRDQGVVARKLERLAGIQLGTLTPNA